MRQSTILAENVLRTVSYDMNIGDTNMVPYIKCS